MDVSNMYIPNASKWIQYYKDGLKKHTFSGKIRNQRGGSLVSGAKTNVSPIDYVKSGIPSKMEVDEVPVKIISPAQAAVEQASEEIKHKAHVKRSVKRRRKTKPLKSGNKHRRRKAGAPIKKKRGRELKKNKKSRSTKKKSKPTSDIFN